MPVFITRFAELTYKFLFEELSSEEAQELIDIVGEGSNEKCFQQMTDDDWLRNSIEGLYSIDEEAALKKLQDRLRES